MESVIGAMGIIEIPVENGESTIKIEDFSNTEGMI